MNYTKIALLLPIGQKVCLLCTQYRKAGVAVSLPAILESLDAI